MDLRLVIISNRLPVTPVIDENGLIIYTPSIGGLTTGISTYLTSNTGSSPVFSEYLWLGYAGIASDDLPETGKEQIQNTLINEYHSYPIFLSNTIYKNFYEGFCNKILWPLFHYFPDKVVYNQEYWVAYKQANELFCEALLQIVKDEDIIWVHDYQLMLLPKMIREKFPLLSIGYFLHIPFPSFELFQTLPSKWSDQLLNGLLGANLIGFHTFDYSRNFLRCVFRMLGYEQSLGQLNVKNRLVKIETFPMGIDFTKFYTAAQHNPVIRQMRQQLTEQLANVKIIFSIDRLDYSKGILQRLQGYEKFLEMYPQWNEKAVLVLVVAPSRINIEDYQIMKQQIDEHVGRINGKFGRVHWSPILYQAQ